MRYPTIASTHIGSQVRASVELALMHHVFLLLCEIVPVMTACDIHSSIIIYAVTNIKINLIEVINNHAFVAARTAINVLNEDDLFVDDEPYEVQEICNLVIIIREFIKDVFFEHRGIYNKLCCVLWSYRDIFFPTTFESYRDFMTRKLPDAFLEANAAFCQIENERCSRLADLNRSLYEKKLRLLHAKNVSMAHIISVYTNTTVKNTKVLSLFLSICEKLGDMIETMAVDGIAVIDIRDIIDRTCVSDPDFGYALHEVVWNVVIPSFGLQGSFKSMEAYLSIS